MRHHDGAAVALGLAIALWSGAAATVHAEDDAVIDCMSYPVLPKDKWDGATPIPSGYVKWASWGDLRICVDRELPDDPRMALFTAGEHPKLPEEGKLPGAPTWCEERLVLKEKDSWTALKGEDLRCASLSQGKHILVIGVHEDPDKRGGVVLFWHHGEPAREAYELVAPWSLKAGGQILDEWGGDVQPRVVPVLERKQKETSFLVARKGRRIVAVVRYRPSGVGGDPYTRFHSAIATVEEREKAKGDITFEPAAPSKELEKFIRDHPPASWDPSLVVVVVHVDERVFLVRTSDDPEQGVVYEIFEKPADKAWNH